MIYTITFNPSIDYIIHTDKLELGITNRSKDEEYYFGGKGINVSWVLKELGKDSVALGFAAGFTGNAIEQGVKNHGINADFIRLDSGTSRINIKIKSAEETEINCQGPDIPQSAVDELFAKIAQIKDGDTLILAGSIPGSMSQDIYEQILCSVSDRNIKCVVDATKNLLLSTLKYKPFLIKPNKQELEEIFSVRIGSEDDIIMYADKLREMGAVNVIISLGREGAILVDERGETHKIGIIPCETVNTVGAGDSMVAGFLAGFMDTCDYEYALRLGTVCGCATASLPGLAEKSRIEEMMRSQINDIYSAK